MQEGKTIEFSPGTHVRLANDPMRTGVVCDGEPVQRGSRTLLLVQFYDGRKRIPIDQIEVISEEDMRSTPVDLLLDGKLGSQEDFRRTLIHTRFSGRLADVIYSMEATNTEFHAYQFKPVIKMLESPSKSLLVADEVGLGKTIEAGLIWTELRSRYSLNKLWVICPSSLCEKWRFELSDKMGIRAVICNANEALKRLRDATRSEAGFSVITSMQGLRPPKGWNDEDEYPDAYYSKRGELARFLSDMGADKDIIDLLIIDEAHHMRNSNTQTHKLGELMHAISEYMVFLSATPIHNYNSDLQALLRLLDPDTFESSDAFSAIIDANEPLVKARDMLIHNRYESPEELTSLLKHAQKAYILETNQQLRNLIPRINEKNLQSQSQKSDIAYRLETVNLLSNAITRTRKREVQEWRVVREPVDALVPMTNVERHFYELVTEAIRDYAMNNLVNEGFVLSMPQRQMTSCMAAAFRSWENRIVDDEEILEDDIDGNQKKDEKQEGNLTEAILSAIKDDDSLNFADLKQQDSKFGKLKERLDEYIQEDPKQKIIIFSAFRSTLAYLKERFDEEGREAIVLQGGGKRPKNEIIEEFRDSDNIKVLLSSEVGGEGVDLQFCHIVINYDLPWNPMRLEQRIGRIDRLGQKSDKIVIVNLLNKDTIDYKIYDYLYRKLDICRKALGEFEAILSYDGVKEIADIYLTKGLSPEQQKERLEQTRQATENKKQEEERLEQEAAHLIAHGDYILQKVNAAKEMNRWINAKDLYTYARDFLNSHYQGCRFNVKNEDKYEFEISLSSDAKYDLSQFIKENRLSEYTRLDNATQLCRFENRPYGEALGKKEIISQFHPLIRFVTKCISQKVTQIHPAVALKLPKSSLQKGELTLGLDAGIYILVASLWSVKGLIETEKLVYGIAKMDSPNLSFDDTDAEKLARISIYEGKQWLEAKSYYDTQIVCDIANSKFADLNEKYEEFKAHEDAKNRDRAEIQKRNLDGKTARQREIIRNTIMTNKEKGQEGLVKANEARLANLETRYEQQSRAIAERGEIFSNEEDICVAVILIE